MTRKPQDVTDAELAVLEQLWQRPWSTVRELAEVLYAPEPAAQHTTVQKLLDRLEGKDCVERNRKVWPHLFRATIARGDLIGRQLQNTADKLCEGELQPLLTHLVKAKKLTDSERKELRKLLDQLDDSQD